MEGLPQTVAMTRPPAGMNIMAEKNSKRLKSRDVHFFYVHFIRRNAKKEGGTMDEMMI
jgi:hypothetical protein